MVEKTEKQTYGPPRLEDLGSLAELTQGPVGSGQDDATPTNTIVSRAS
jgi:hypothetical protein